MMFLVQKKEQRNQFFHSNYEITNTVKIGIYLVKNISEKSCTLVLGKITY